MCSHLLLSSLRAQKGKGMKPRSEDSNLVSHMGCRNPVTRTISTAPSSGNASTGSCWSREQSPVLHQALQDRMQASQVVS